MKGRIGMVDIVLVLVLGIFVFVGAKKGFIKSLIGVTSTIVSFLLTSLLYRPLAIVLKATPLKAVVESILKKGFENERNAAIAVKAAAPIVIDIIAFVLMIFIVKIIVALLAKFGNVASKIPVIKQANAILGGVIGLISGLLICYIVIGVIVALGANGTCKELAENIRASFFASELAGGNLLTEILLPVL